MPNAQDSCTPETQVHRPRRLVPLDEARQLPDFIDFLSERLATNRAAAMDVLTTLVEAYQPVRAYEICLLEPTESPAL